MSRNGRRRQGRWCWVRFAPFTFDHEDQTIAPIPQVGYAIGKSVGNAVIRNRIRRRIRPLLAEATLLPGFYLIGVKNDRAATVSYDMLRTDLYAVLQAATDAAGAK